MENLLIALIVIDIVLRIAFAIFTNVIDANASVQPMVYSNPSKSEFAGLIDF